MTLTHTPQSRSRRWLAMIAVLFVTALPLHAHHLPPGMEEVDEFENEVAFAAGLRHPLLGLDHVALALIAGALVITSARSGGVALAALLTGGIAGAQGMMPPDATWSIVPAAFVALLAWRWNDGRHARQSASAILLAAAAFLQGMDHGAAWPLQYATASYLLGIAATTGVLACLGRAIAAGITRLASCAPAETEPATR